MRKRILVRTIIISLILGIVMFFMLNTVIANRVTQKMLSQDKENMYDAASYLVNMYRTRYAEEEGSFDDILIAINTIEEVNGYGVWIVSEKGIVLLDTTDSKAVGTNVYNIYPKMFEQTFTEGLIIPGCLDEPSTCAMMSIINNFNVKGYVCVFESYSVAARNADLFIRSMNIYLLLTFFIYFLCLLIQYFMVIIPVSKLGKIARAYSTGNVVGDIKEEFGGPFAELAEAILYMGDMIETREQSQKKFIANISHDFRSPLTNIKGYVNAMKDGTIPVEMQEKYFDIVLHETERLQKLTQGLIDLNKMDANKMALDIMEFDLVPMLREIIPTFENACEAKSICIEVDFTAKSFVVVADPDKIQQVIYNLIDNAIKFSKNDGVITIKVRERGKKAYVSVKDRGDGISKENINKIWDRFYKVDQSRGKDKKGTGIGLAIIKEIISAHSETISVASTEGVGTEFTFSLTLAEKE